MARQKDRSYSKEGLIFRAPSRLLSSIPDCVTGQESQFADFPHERLPHFCAKEGEYLVDVSDKWQKWQK